jgi:hypothetical protein
MNLSQEKITKNAKKFFQTGQEYGFMPESLVTFLGTEIIAAPASTRKDMHNAFEGGLIDHTLKVTSYAVKLNDILPEAKKIDKASLVKVCCLHQIGKAKLYKICESQWHRDNQGKMYDFNDDMISMKVGERSALYALQHGVELTEEEFSAIVFHDRDESDAQVKWHNSMLGEILKMANILAIREEKIMQ